MFRKETIVNIKSKIFLLVLSGSILSACSTVKVPDFVNLPEFREASGSSSAYPDPADAPPEATNLRSASAWDKAASELISKRDNFEVPPGTDPLTDEEIQQQINALKSKVKEYKLDDPVEF